MLQWIPGKSVATLGGVHCLEQHVSPSIAYSLQYWEHKYTRVGYQDLIVLTPSSLVNKNNNKHKNQKTKTAI